MSAQDNLSHLQFGVEETSEGHPHYEAYAYHPEHGTIGEVQLTQHPDNRVSFDYPIYVQPNHRRKGIATQILRTVKKNFPGHTIDPVKFTQSGKALFNSTEVLK